MRRLFTARVGRFALVMPMFLGLASARAATDLDPECILEIVGMGPATATPAEEK